MSEQEFPQRVTPGQDGVYRWSYDMDMYANHYLRNILLKVLAVISIALYAFLMMLLSSSGGFSPQTALYAALPFLGLLLLKVLGYYLAAAIMHGRYRLRFEMKEDAIRLVRTPASQRVMRAAADVATLADTRVGHTLTAAASNGVTPYKSVRSIRERPEYDAINLRDLTGANQICVPKEDYAFVRDYIWTRLPDKAKRRSTAAWPKRLSASLWASLLLNVLSLAINVWFYPQTYRLPLAVTKPGFTHPEQWAFAMRVYLTGYRGGGILRYDFSLEVLFLLVFALIIFILLTVLAQICKNSMGE